MRTSPNSCSQRDHQYCSVDSTMAERDKTCAATISLNVDKGTRKPTFNRPVENDR